MSGFPRTALPASISPTTSTARFVTGQWLWGAAAAMTESRQPPPHRQLVLGGPPHPPRSLQVTTALHTTSFQSVLKQNATQKIPFHMVVCCVLLRLCFAFISLTGQLFLNRKIKSFDLNFFKLTVVSNRSNQQMRI